jgi:signal transduction histidine kinase/ActR/RegA family two-component response regulator
MMNLTTNWCGQGQSTVPLAMKVLEPGTVDGCLEELSAMVADEDVKVKFKDTLKREHLLEAFRQGQTRLSIEYPIVYPDGERYWRRGLLSMLQNPRTGDVEAAAAIIDIDLQKKNEQIVDIITKEELEYIGLIHPATGTFEFINKHKAISYGEVGKRLDYEECRRYVGLNFVDSGERAHFEQCTSISAISAGLRENGRWASSYQRTENGRVSRRHLQYRWLDKPEGDILVIRTDITAAYEQEQERLKRVSDALLSAERANEAKSTFLSSMSHDLRTPLNGVIGFTELAIKEADQDKKQDYLEKIRMSGSLLLSLINDTLDLSRIESGKLVLRPEAVDSRELGETVITALRPAAELKNVRIEADQDGFPDETIWVDKLSMQKVLVNLLSNAIKYTLPGGTVTMRVEKLDPPENGRTRRIVVEDSGIGIGPEFIPHLFEPFSQENRSEAGNVAGTGLGLAIVKRIIDLMDGEITVESKLGEGTRFTIDIPLRSAAAGDGTKHGEAVDTVRLDGKKLLMCEDNYLNREIAEIILRQRGALVDCAVNGREGVEKFSASAPGEYAAVLMDMRMPELDGCGAARKIRSLPRPDAAAVPIIAMSADAFDEDMRRAAEAGMDDYVTKPIKAAELYSAIVKQIVRDRGRTPD